MSRNPLEGYAESYDSMSRDKTGDGRVNCSSVAHDIRQNMIPAAGRARLFAMAAHSALQQVRKYSGIPYHTHPQCVRKILETHVSWATPDMLDAADLHDIVEDVGVHMLPLIFDEFGAETARLVKGLTNVKKGYGDSKLNRRAQKLVDANRLKLECRNVKTIKLADKLHNLPDIIANDPAFAPTYVAEARHLLYNSLIEGDEKLWNMLNKVIVDYYQKNPLAEQTVLSYNASYIPTKEKE